VARHGNDASWLRSAREEAGSTEGMVDAAVRAFRAN